MELPRPFGPYTLLRRLAVGGMAEVYIAKARGIGGFEKLVAIKVIHPRYSEDDHFVTMLVDEAKLSVLLTHANIAQTFDLGCIDETYFIVMELVEGADAYKLLKRANEVPAQVPTDIAAYIASEMCQGLDYAHRKRDMTGAPLHIVHRDISPQNVLISFAGEVKIVDFGIAKAAQRSGNTEVGVIKGKYYYMSPEQAWADPVDHRSDIFSTGIVLHELLTGKMVYEEENLPKLLDRVRKAEIPPPSRLRPSVPPELDEIVMRALAREPVDRYERAQDFAQALSQFLYRHMPTFTAARLAGMMAELFPGATVGDGVHLGSGERVLASVETADSTQEMTDAARPMKAEEFRPDPNKSVIFDLGDDFGDEATSNEVPRALAVQRAAKQAQDLQKEWEDATTGAKPSSKGPTGGIGQEEDTWEDATLVDDTDDLMRKMKDLLERQVAEKNRQGSPKSEDRTLPFDRAELPWSIRAKAEAAKAAGHHPGAPRPPRAGPPRAAPPRPSAPPPPPSGRDEDATKPVIKKRASEAVSWPPAPPSPSPAVAPKPAEARSVPEARLPEPVSAPDPAGPGQILNTHRLASLTADAKRASRRKILFVVGAVALTLLAALLGRALFTQPPPAPTLEVRSVPSGARVFFDGREVAGETPLVIDEGIEIGKSYPVQVQLDGYEAWSATYEARPGPMSQIAPLVPVRVDLSIRTDPPGGRVWVDGVDHGREPIELSGMPVGRELRLRARIEGREVRQTHRVTPEGGTLTLNP